MAVSQKTVTGKVTNVSVPKTSVKGDKYVRIEIDGVWFSVWNPPEDLSVKVGDMVKCCYVDQGNFKNIKTVDLVDDGINVEMKRVQNDVDDVSFESADKIDPNKRIDDDLKEIKYKLDLIVEILKKKFDLDIE